MSEGEELSPWARRSEAAQAAGRPNSPLAAEMVGAPAQPPANDTQPDLPADDDELAPPEAVSVGPVAAESIGSLPWWGRAAALMVAAALVVVGGYVAFSTAGAQGGAETPEAALEKMIDALSAGDLFAAAELVVANERSTLLDAGFEIVAELSRLEVLADDLDLDAVRGARLDFTGLEVRAELPRTGLVNLYLVSGVVSSKLEVDELPLGAALIGRLPADWLSLSQVNRFVVEPFDQPIVAIERDGRWYLSLWYSLAEGLRLAADLPLPDPLDQPARIGAETPEAAVRGLIAEVLRLDVRRMIGMLDPEESEALYAYAPLFLGGSTRAANDTLARLEDDRWAWGMDSLELTAAEAADGLSSVSLNGFVFSASSDDAVLHVTVTEGTIRATFDDVDLWGDRRRRQLDSDGSCFTITAVETAGRESERTCANQTGLLGMGLLGIAASIAAPISEITSLSLVTREVGGRWFVSPVQTGAATYLQLLRALSTEELEKMIDEFVAFIDNPAGVGDLTPTEILPPPTIGPAPGGGSADTTPFSVVNGDLLAAGLDLAFAFDLDESNAASEIGLWAPSIAELPIERGVAATMHATDGEIAFDVLVAATPADASAAVETVAAQEGAVVTFDDGGLVIVEVVGEQGVEVVVGALGDRVIVVAPLGASPFEVSQIVKRLLP